VLNGKKVGHRAFANYVLPCCIATTTGFLQAKAKTVMFTIRLKTRKRCCRDSRQRRGYALLVCMLVAVVSSVAVMGIMNTVRFETMEASAKQQSTAANWEAKAGVERGVAQLLVNKAFRGTMPKFQIPGTKDTVTVTIRQQGQNITVSSVALANSLSTTQSITFTVNQLQQRIASVPK
jgi:type II secretory pathway component PulK